MKLRADDSTFELEIEAYQFSESADYWDSNWVIICGDVTTCRGNWTFRDPCLTTFEVKQLAEWFDAIDELESDNDEGYFTEPNLRFEFKAKPTPTVFVTIAHECAPPWQVTFNERFEGCTIGFPTDTNKPVESARFLRAMLDKFPIRGSFGDQLKQ